MKIKKAIDARRFERFKVNGKKAEQGDIPVKSATSRSPGQRIPKSRYLNLGERIPTVKEFSVQPFAQGLYFEVDDILISKISHYSLTLGTI